MGGSPWQTFELTTPVPLEAGDQYTWELTGAGGIQYGLGNPYEGGIAGNEADLDMAFRAYHQICP